MTAEAKPKAEVESLPTVLAEAGATPSGSGVGAVSARGPESKDDAFLGTMLGDTYKVVGILAEGGMGRIYEAEHVRIGRRYVVKVIHTPLAHRDDLKVRFDREARAMTAVRSDHVLDVIDVLPAGDGRMCIVTEKLEGRDLDHKLASGGRLSIGEAAHLLRQACRGVASAHALGIVHRDLKPSNLFLAEDGSGNTTLKILDFGVAKMAGDAEMTGTGVIVGTPSYMAPEQARSALHTDVRADVYALGAVLYRMTTGRAPYGGGDASATLVRLLEEAPQRASLVEKSITPAIEAVIERAMARDPAHRYATVTELDAALAPFDEPERATLAGKTMVGAASSLGSAVKTASANDKALAWQARRARPLAALAATTLVLAAGASVGVTLALVVDGLTDESTLDTAELVLVALGALVALGGTGTAAFRALSSAWRSIATVEAETSRMVRALLVGLATLGVLELGSSAYAALHLHQPASNDPLWAAARVLVAFGAGAIVAAIGQRAR